jgi:hypothetical protein
MLPLSSPEINSDGIRLQGEASQIREADFVVLMLGDSFTFGEHLSYEDSYPAQLERLLQSRNPTQRIRVVNFGWVSASPLLALRQLKDIGAKYHPDLVIYNLDVTDFHDDLRYARDLAHPVWKPPSLFSFGVQVVAGLTQRWAWAREIRLAFLNAIRFFKKTHCSLSGDGVPDDRFYVVNCPLEFSDPLIRRGVLSNLLALQEHCRRVLRAEFAVAILPRGFQFSTQESQGSWEKHLYRGSQEFAQSPFQFFMQPEIQARLPTLSLLHAFQASSVSPLYFNHDPHWNPSGAKVAALTVASWIESMSVFRDNSVPSDGLDEKSTHLHLPPPR